MLEQIIHKARRRLLFNEALRQFALAAVMAIAGLAIMLTVGTRYLQWWVIALLAGGFAAWAFVKLRRHWPSEYTAAIWLDDKAGLHDSLSTAHYFSKTNSRPPTPESEAFLRAQRGQAESAAGGVDLSITVPFRFPKALYGLALLLLASSGLVGVRYFYGHTLDLNAPITEVIFQDMAAVKTPAKSASRAKNEKAFDEATSMLARLGFHDKLDSNSDEKLDEALADALKGAPRAPGAGENARPTDSPNNGDPMQPQDKSQASQKNQNPGNDGKKAGDPSNSPGNPDGAQSGEKGEQSLLSKLKDAMNDMLGSPPKGDSNGKQKSQQQRSDSKGSKAQTGQQPQEAGDDQNKTAADGEASGNAEAGKTPGKTSGNLSDQKQEGPSVAGTQDGEKAVKAAQQMAAMGKISELIGKRADTVTGDSMIDVQSGDQHLQTAYKNNSATHGVGAGEVSRDEIPLSVQSYVQEYFQQVRKPDAKASKKNK